MLVTFWTRSRKMFLELETLLRINDIVTVCGGISHFNSRFIKYV